MAITPRPKRNEEAHNADVDAIIAKGGSVAGGAVEENLNSQRAVPTKSRSKTSPRAQITPQSQISSEVAKDYGAFTLRVPANLLDELDKHRKSRRVKISRQQWILEAIEQRLESEGAIA